MSKKLKKKSFSLAAGASFLVGLCWRVAAARGQSMDDRFRGRQVEGQGRKEISPG